MKPKDLPAIPVEPSQLNITDYLVRFDIHIVTHRTGIGTAFTLVAGGNIGICFTIDAV
jgi:hypothetical protein